MGILVDAAWHSTVGGGLMNGTDSPKDPLTALEREALEFVVHLRSGSATQYDAAALIAWREQSPEHERALHNVIGIRRGLQEMLKSQVGAEVVPFPAHRQLSRRSFVAGGAIAASAAGILALTRPPLDLWPAFGELMADHRTGTGERRTIQPIAGVRVEMNTRTSINDLHHGDGLTLVAGEAFVEVARQADFTIAVGECTLRSAAARFNVRSLNDQTSAACIDGAVAVTLGDQTVVVEAGREIDLGGGRLGRPAATDGNALSWREGRLVFIGRPLDEVIAEVNRYRAGRILLADAALGRQPISAVFYIDQIQNAPARIEELLGRRGTALPGGVVLIT